MNRRLFGTDGIRGTANQGDMTAETALRVGMAAGAQFIQGDLAHRVVIGKDTRLSGYMIEPALTSGFISMGVNVTLVGPMPTPAVAMLTRSLRADLGVMISASHNPFQDNGIKLFGPDGYKLSDTVEAEIEAQLENGFEDKLTAPEELGRARRLDDSQGRYVEYVKQTFPRGLRLEGLKIAVDCAYGAAYKVAPNVLWELGADIVPIGVDPDGFNINKGCGSTPPEFMQRQTMAHGADLGMALDGDGDRLLGTLRGGGIVSTVMSNLGLERYLSSVGLEMARTQVGDRYVVEHMRANDFNVGGEQSGHIILSDYSTTGDGLIAALQVLAVLVTTGKRASEVCRPFEPMPQLLTNVRFNGGQPLDAKAVKQAIAEGEDRLGSTGRLLNRKSGTEPLIRVMAEGEDAKLVAAVVGDIAGVIEQAAD